MTRVRRNDHAGASVAVPATFADLNPSVRRERIGLWTRRVVIALFCVLAVLGLLDVFGQAPSSTSAASPVATMKLTAPDVLRGGLFFQSKLEIHADRAIAFPRIVLDDGWVEGMQFNSTEPAPASEASRDGRVVFTYDKLDAGDVLRIWLQFQVNPTNIGRRDYGVELDDAATRLVRVDRSITVLP
jgi:hypothetical protein